jgi:hypothetical protein
MFTRALHWFLAWPKFCVKVKVMLRPTLSRPIFLRVKHPFGAPRPDFYYCQTVVGLLMWGALSDERTDLSFIISASPRQRSHIYRLWPLAAIWLPEFYYNFCDCHYSVFSLGPIELWDDLPKYRCDYCGHVIPRGTVCFRSLNSVLVVGCASRDGGTHFSHCGGVGLCN